MTYELLPTQRALLVWQSPLRPAEEGGKRDCLVRDHHAVGELVRKKSGKVSFRYFDDLEAACAQGFRGYPGLRLGRKANEKIGFEELRRRLPPDQRTDFGKILQKFDLFLEDIDRSDHLTLLAYTGARDDDSFSICETFDGFDRPFRFLIDLANVRHDGTYDVCAKLVPGEALNFKREPNNPHDPNAIKVVRTANEKEKAGYVNHLQAKAFGRWVDEGEITARAFKFTERSVYPRLFVNVNVSPCVVEPQKHINEVKHPISQFTPPKPRMRRWCSHDTEAA